MSLVYPMTAGVPHRDQPALVDARPAAMAAILSHWRRHCPVGGVLLLLPEAEQAWVPEIQRVFRDLDVPLLGAIFPALITPEGFASEGAWLIGLAPMPPWFLLDHLNAGARTAHSRISHAVGSVCAPMAGQAAPTLFLIFDAMVPKIGSILNGVYRTLRTGVRYAGVNAGSETFQPMPCLFDRDAVVAQGVAGLLLPAAGIIVEHGYPVAATHMHALSTTGNRINIINGRPAFAVYQEAIDADFGVTLTRDNFYDYAVHYPFGLIMATEVLVRIPVAFAEDGAITCVGEVPPNAVLRVIKAPTLAESHCVAALADRLHERSGALADTLVTFYCAGRRLHFGASATEELEQLRCAAGVSQLAGALSLGEIDTLEDFGTPVFHNAALVCW